MSDRPIKFSSSLSSSKDDLPAHHSSGHDISNDWRLFDYCPPWSSEKEDPEEEDEDAADATDDDDDDSDFDSPPPKRTRRT